MNVAGEWAAAEIDDLVGRVPVELAPLARAAFDYAWTWHPDGPSLFRDVDPMRWASTSENPVRLLQETTRARLTELAASSPFCARALALETALAASRRRPCATLARASDDRPIAFVCAEYAIHRSLPIYAGGLGALAGDVLKTASDLALPLVGVGLLYRRGYFHQRLDPSGWQHESWTTEDPTRMPLTLVRAGDGTAVRVGVTIGGARVMACIWRAMIGRVSLYLLDADVPENAPVDRWITATLYSGDREQRLKQYVLLGVGGMRALRVLGLDPSVIHLNEGHAALATLETARKAIESGMDPTAAIAHARARTIFTTHTPVAAGNERYGRGELSCVLGPGATEPAFAALLESALDDGSLGMTELALARSRSTNGVSRRHGEVARAMWRHRFRVERPADVPITHVTNGVHVPTWIAPAMRAFLDRWLGDGWLARADDPETWRAIDRAPDEELWSLRASLRASLVEFVRERSVYDRLARGESLSYANRAATTFDPNVLTVGFARRVASYKRLHLLFQDSARAIALLGGPRPIQVVIAGKAHPRDDEAKRTVQALFAFKDVGEASRHVVFLEDYDLAMAARLVHGCDVWLNLPTPPLEASGTSGMKAAVNGGLNLSVLDGWWCEGFDQNNGWAIASDPNLDPATRDARDAACMYSLLEREVVPLFHDRDQSGVARGWIARVKASLRTNGPRFSSTRMMRDYVALYGKG